MAQERVVYKYPLPVTTEVVRIELPADSHPIHFAAQHDVLTVWLDRPVEPGEVFESHEFLVRGTGDPTPDGPWAGFGSVLVDDGMFVFHLYSRIVEIPHR